MTLSFGKIEQTAFFRGVKPEELYRALLDPKVHSEFTGSPAKTSATPGAEFQAWDGYILGKNLELIEGKKIVQEWETTEWPQGYPRSRLEFALSPKKGGTELKMTHSRVPASQVEKYTEGWESSYWTPLKEYFARRAPGRIKLRKAGESRRSTVSSESRTAPNRRRRVSL